MTVEKAFTEANNQARTILITVQICKKKKQNRKATLEMEDGLQIQ